MNPTTLEWFCESFEERFFKTFEERNEESSFDRVEFYKGYFKNLSPKEFKVSREDNKIIITIDSE